MRTAAKEAIGFLTSFKKTCQGFRNSWRDKAVASLPFPEVMESRVEEPWKVSEGSPGQELSYTLSLAPVSSPPDWELTLITLCRDAARIPERMLLKAPRRPMPDFPFCLLCH